MKNFYFIIMLLFSSILFGQTNFTNTGGDFLWSNSANWSAGIPTATSAYTQLNTNVTLDVATTLNFPLRSALSSTLSGTGKVTFGGTAVALLTTGGNFTYNGNAEINGTSLTVAKTLQINSPGTQLTLGPASVLTLTNLAKTYTTLSTAKVVFQGVINGDADLQFAAKTEFDTGSDNTAFTGDMVFLNSGTSSTGASVTANTTGDGYFLRAGAKIQVNSTGGSLTLNGANSCDGNISLALTNSFTLNINANQESFGTVLVKDGTLSINVASGVTNLSFANSSAVAWGTGAISITGYESGKIRFGTSNTALTAQQLSQITADGAATSQALGLDANGYLVLASSLLTSWTGGTSSDWTAATNWSNGVPNLSSNVTIAAGATFQPTIATNVSINKLTIDSGASLSVTANNFTVTGAIANSGTMTLANNVNLIQGGTTNSNTGNITITRNSNALSRLDYTIWSSPVVSQDLLLFSPSTLTDPSRFYSYNESTNLYNAITNPSGTLFEAAAGYLIRMPDNASAFPATQTFAGVFTGVPNNGTILKPVTYLDATHGYNMVGNPYPSTIDAESFISANSASIESSLYFWRKINGAIGSAYAVYNSLGSTQTPSSEIPNGTIQVGQGFIVKAKSGATTVSFTNTMRVANSTGQFFRTKKVDKDRVWLNLTNAAGAFSQALVGYTADASSGVDLYDAKYINDSETALTSKINDEEYTIQGRPAFDPSDVVALNFKTDVAGDYTISLDHFDGVFTTGQEVYLFDSKTGLETDLKAGAYTFTATVGEDNTRFSLNYQKTLKLNPQTFNDNSVTIYRNNGSVFVNSIASTINNIKVFDIQGRLLSEQKNVNANTAKISDVKTHQVLIVKVTSDDNNQVSKKVVN